MIRLVIPVLCLAGSAAVADSGPLTMTGSKGELALATGQMIEAEAYRYGDLIDVTVTLGPDSAAALGVFTALHVGEEIRILSCGKVLFTPRIIEPINAGAITVAGLQIPEALALYDVITGKTTCP